jgi:hypothetical protein
MTTSEKRNWHAIEGPNGRCACGQQPDGTFKDCAQLLAEEVGRENRTLREALEKDLAEWEAVQADNPLDILQHCITRVRAALAASAPARREGKTMSDRLVTFLYLLTRDELPSGQVERLLAEVERADAPTFSAPFVEAQAREWTARLVAQEK